MKILCPYCGRPAKLVTGAEVYRAVKHRNAGKLFWLCKPCDAWVGCHDEEHHEEPAKPLGTLAKKNLRAWRQFAHEKFDVIWRENHMERTNAYNWLAQKLGIPYEECHIGFFDVEQCKKTIKESVELFRRRR